MISHTLKLLHAEGLLTLRDFEVATGISDSTFYRWCTGETEPTCIAVQQLIAHHPDDRVKAALIGAMLRGSGFVAAAMPPELDVNGDGQIDLLDALASANASIEVLAKMGAELHKDLSNKKHKVEELEVAHFQERGGKATRGVIALVSIVESIHATQSQRKKARPFAVGGSH